jgi:hypothetical protein
VPLATGPWGRPEREAREDAEASFLLLSFDFFFLSRDFFWAPLESFPLGFRKKHRGARKERRQHSRTQRALFARKHTFGGAGVFFPPSSCSAAPRSRFGLLRLKERFRDKGGLRAPISLFFYLLFLASPRQKERATTPFDRRETDMLPQAGGYAAFGGYGKLDDARGLK